MHIEVVVDGNYVIEYVVGKTDFSLYTLRYLGIINSPSRVPAAAQSAAAPP